MDFILIMEGNHLALHRAATQQDCGSNWALWLLRRGARALTEAGQFSEGRDAVHVQWSILPNRSKATEFVTRAPL